MSPIASTLLVARRSAALLTVLVSLSIGLSSAAGQQRQGPASPSVEQQVVQASQQWFEALSRGDAAALDQFETSDFIAIQQSPQGIVMTAKTAQLETLKKGTNRVKLQRQLGGVRVRSYGNVAVLTAIATFRGEDTSGTPINSQAFTSEVWVSEGGRWRVAHFQPINTPPRAVQ